MKTSRNPCCSYASLSKAFIRSLAFLMLLAFSFMLSAPPLMAMIGLMLNRLPK
ncbi:Uncharacterised protein [Mycobacteroides abscessus subsp. abscessus]|nr:Uncharacterised protein [Mycobacteroides abscessus subsp. abscessus]